MKEWTGKVKGGIMFIKKKKGLRTLRSSVVLFVVIFITPMVLMVLLLPFITPPPIYPEYINIIKEIETGKNVVNLLDINEGMRLVDNLFCGFFQPMQWKVYVSEPGTRDIKPGKTFSPSEFLLLPCYCFLTDRQLIEEELESYKTYGDLYFPNKDRVLSDCIKWEKEWENSFKCHSEKLLEIIQQIVNKYKGQSFKYYPFNSKGNPQYILETRKKWDLIVYLNVILNIKDENYGMALEWIRGYSQFLELIGGGCSYFFFDHKVMLNCINLLPFYYSFPDYFYGEIIHLLISLKNNYETVDFWEMYWYELFEVEDRYAELELGMDKISLIGNRTQSLGNKFKMLFNRRKAYTSLSRIVAKYRPDLESATWKDAEDAVFYNRGKLVPYFNSVVQHANEYSYNSPHYYSQGLNIPTLGGTKRYVYSHHLWLAYFYGSIVRVILEYYRSCYGTYPDSIKEFLGDFLKEEEIVWIDNSIDIIFYEDKYLIICYPMPKDVRAGLPREHRFFSVYISLPMEIY